MILNEEATPEVTPDFANQIVQDNVQVRDLQTETPTN